jgi:predicted nucleic acid-binding protein
VRAVLDPNIIISAMLSASRAPAQILREWREGAFELIASGQSGRRGHAGRVAGLVTGDGDLLELGRDLPICTPATFVQSLIEGGVSPSERWTW